MRSTLFCLIAFALLPSAGRAQVPVFEITPGESSVKFDVEASVAIKGTFDKWDATLTFAPLTDSRMENSGSTPRRLAHMSIARCLSLL
jgi:polyisoprenoid-binding protein YceI